ncbi:class I SAM-dependent methyltransferase [Rhizobium sp. KVB221]|uniref:Class I SAM-dependent methyltransferase n=1 Tax=Rhizobium setariae TaxID=2801340 RepID=A0A936YL30_9HYPH|nr:class I SAM-dependent methyltransferase [Rhizobium setariae]MBL0371538.1 class I SAM-dependent methyltransferase [Rhizobium setariae]
MSVEEAVAHHYTHGSLENAILDALRGSGKDVDHLTPSDLAGGDEFHLGWRGATIELAGDLSFAHDAHVLDVGSGLGGPARYLVTERGCRVTGIDLTDEFVEVANALTHRCGLANRATFRQASAHALPFPDATFDGAMMIHVGMNISDKAGVFAEVRRVLKPGARFGVYDIMHVGNGEITFPVPWASSRLTSFVERPEVYRRQLADAHLSIETERDLSELAIRLGKEMRENAERDGAPPLGPQVIMGPTAGERLRNVTTALQTGVIAPIEMICRAV